MVKSPWGADACWAEAFDVVNANGDASVCYKEYPSPPHQGGHYGNFTDNTANPAAQQEG